MSLTLEKYKILCETWEEILPRVPEYRFGQHVFNWTSDCDYELYESLILPLDETYGLFYMSNQRAIELIKSYIEE